MDFLLKLLIISKAWMQTQGTFFSDNGNAFMIFLGQLHWFHLLWSFIQKYLLYSGTGLSIFYHPYTSPSWSAFSSIYPFNLNSEYLPIFSNCFNSLQSQYCSLCLLIFFCDFIIFSFIDSFLFYGKF